MPWALISLGLKIWCLEAFWSFSTISFMTDVKIAKFFVVLCTKKSCHLVQFLEIV